MSTITVQVDEDLAALLHASNQPIQQAARELMILELYRRGTVSSGKAAQMLGMARFEFIQHASRLGIAFFDMTEDEWATERERADLL
ncbi:MAG TPA: UPF0175 family protein [Herpetosiphonaceae bacterium]